MCELWVFVLVFRKRNSDWVWDCLHAVLTRHASCAFERVCTANAFIALYTQELLIVCVCVRVHIYIPVGSSRSSTLNAIRARCMNNFHACVSQRLWLCSTVQHCAAGMDNTMVCVFLSRLSAISHPIQTHLLHAIANIRYAHRNACVCVSRLVAE